LTADRGNEGAFGNSRVAAAHSTVARLGLVDALYIYSFPPIESPDTRILILGSMPGRASLNAGQYYAHPQNAFWRLMSDLMGSSRDLPYESRIEMLRSRGIALWDVLKRCVRESSLDSDIAELSITPNDFELFYRDHPRIAHVFFNGAKAEDCYRKHVQPSLPVSRALHYLRLPSTSPANASMSYNQKLKAWKAIVK
jgi:TDG/mug DNA glycosylase family protein